MWLLALEAVLAAGLLLFIVWWTLGPAHRRDREMLEKLKEERAREAAERRADDDAP